MKTESHSRDSVPRRDDPRGLPPYPLNRGEIGFWLRHGEQLARAAGRIAATIAAGCARAARWLQLTTGGPSNPPPQPG